MNDTPVEKKPMLFFIPHYVGSFKYFEKLAPHLSRYDVRFLLIFGRKSYKDMCRYAEEKKLNAYLMAGPKPSYFDRLPLISFARAALRYKKEVAKFFKTVPNAKLVSANDQGFYMKYLFRKANERGFETMVLQWSLMYPEQRERLKSSAPPVRRFLYRFGKPIYLAIKKIIGAIIFGGREDSSKGYLGAGNAQQLGVINEQAYEDFKAHGIPPEKMSVVGYLDFEIARETQKNFSKSGAKQLLEKHYGFDSNKKHIVIFSSPFHRSDLSFITPKDQFDYTEMLFKTIREFCSPEQYEILFKTHPSEKPELYLPLKEKYQVKFLDRNVVNAEVVFLSDLYIATSSTTNFTPILMGKDALFLNFHKLIMVSATKKYFGIKQFIEDPAEFRRLISEFRQGRLEKQYEVRSDIFTDDSLKKIISWIG